ncbi:MAG: SdiA-regulated domain-containing protein [Flavitalea sp.]
MFHNVFKDHNCFRKLLLYSMLGFLVGAISCTSKQEEIDESPRGYNLNSPSVLKLPPALDEISGIVYYPKDRSVLAINDEVGWLYKIHLKEDPDIQKWKYSNGADFEDLVLFDSTFYVLESNGNILKFKFVRPDSAATQEFIFPAPGKNEFEILYHDPRENKLILLCKDCEIDNKNSLTAFSFDLNSMAFSPDPAFVIDIRKIEDLLDEKRLRFKPSAAAIHPKTGELYIMSSINKVLVVADLNGIPKKVYKISARLYKQPEGMTFTSNGDMIISNESADIGAANILFLKYKSAAK